VRIKLEGYSYKCMPAPHALYSKVLAERTASQNVLVLLTYFIHDEQRVPSEMPPRSRGTTTMVLQRGAPSSQLAVSLLTKPPARRWTAHMHRALLATAPRFTPRTPGASSSRARWSPGIGGAGRQRGRSVFVLAARAAHATLSFSPQRKEAKA